MNHEEKPTSSSHNSSLKGDLDGLPKELRDTQRPYEIDSNGRNEMPGTKSRIVPVFDGDVDSASVIAKQRTAEKDRRA